MQFCKGINANNKSSETIPSELSRCLIRVSYFLHDYVSQCVASMQLILHPSIDDDAKYLPCRGEREWIGSGQCDLFVIDEITSDPRIPTLHFFMATNHGTIVGSTR